MIRIEGLIFDLDGTLLDSKRTILRCLNAALSEFGFEEFADDDLYSMIGMDLGEILDIKGADRPDVRDWYTEKQLSTFMQDMTLYDGTPELLKSMKDAGYIIGVVTMRRSRIALEVMSGLGIKMYFDQVVGADDVREPKPSPVHTLAACDNLGLEPERVAMIGDSKLDMLSAKAAGCTAVGVTWGMGSVRELEESGADHMVHSMKDLAGLLLKMK